MKFLQLHTNKLKLENVFRIFYLRQSYCTCSSVIDRPNKQEDQKRRMLIHAKGKTFVDWKKVHLYAGKGGKGCVSFMHARSHKGGPNGGDGGMGGDIYVFVDENFTQLSHLKSHYRALNGSNGVSSYKQGKKGKDLSFSVPVGTTIKDCDTGEVMLDLMEHGKMVRLLWGGAGGLGNSHFKAPDHVRPEEFSYGESGEERVVEIELKSIADIGLVGFPNAGKSTLLRAVSRALPKVASYPFTTLKPNIGVIQYDDNVNITVADIPGLVEGAHQNKGLGHVFLRHVERCRGLIYVVDIVNSDPLKQFIILKNELEMYQQNLSTLPAIFVANKLDLLSDNEQVIKDLENEVGIPVVGVSGKYGHNIDNLKEMLYKFRKF